MRFDICGELVLTEVDHDLDARNSETVPTVQADGSCILHSPSNSVAKTMQPATPQCSIPRGAIVFARLLVDEEDRGTKVSEFN